MASESRGESKKRQLRSTLAVLGAVCTIIGFIFGVGVIIGKIETSMSTPKPPVPAQLPLVGEGESTIQWLSPSPGWQVFGGIRQDKKEDNTFVFYGENKQAMGVSSNALTPDAAHDTVRVEVAPFHGKARFLDAQTMFKVSVGSGSQEIELRCATKPYESEDSPPFVKVRPGSFDFPVPTDLHGQLQKLTLTFWDAELQGLELKIGILKSPVRGAE
ncbi:MAG: hypothetical protein NTZ09_07360 [Candidatus Hydrogenedentes bacterium]|nr:hypothetical protein [Candidatus Hydrogenedentota bacterium]